MDKAGLDRPCLWFISFAGFSRMRAAVLALLLVSAAAPAQIPANFTRAEPAEKIDTIPAAQDIPFPGTMIVAVDATDTERGIFTIQQRIPVNQAGDLVLLYPKWLPGNHAPSGPINKESGRASCRARVCQTV